MAQDDFLTFVERVKQAESRGQRFGKDGKLLTSPKGAQGEMQVMPATQRKPGFGITPVRDDSPDEIARVGRDLLKALDNHYGGNKMYAAAAYNWGKSNVDKWIANGADFNKLPKETQGYLKRIQPETLPSMAKKAPADTPEVGPAVMEPPLGISASAAPAKSAAPAAVAAAPIARPEDLGSGYKAALALSFLGSEDRDRPTTDSELEDRLNETALAEFNKELEDYTPKNALADVEITALNPVKALQSSQPVEPVRMAAGGVPYNPIARVLPSARAQLESIKKDYERYNAAVPQFNAALQKYQTEVYQPYEQAINRYNAEIEAYNAGPREADFTGTAPTAPAEFSMAAPTAPSVTQAQYDQMAADAKKSAARRQMALVVASDPGRFGLSINKFFADGGEVTGQPQPENESMSSKMLKAIVPMDSRIFGSTLFGSRDPITEKNFSAEELAAMQQAVDQAAKRTGKTEKGAVDYVDYPRGEQIGPGFQPVGQTLGRFVYEKQPDGTTVIRDRYDFYNEGRKSNIESYEKMGKGEKALTVSRRMLKNLVTGNLRGIPGEVADAYIGREGRDVTIKLPPVKRAGGGEAEPTPEEIAAASRPATFNPNIARQGAAARALAAQRDVNTLPDPRTYAAVSGFLGQAPDELGFSAMHPDIKGITTAGEAGYAAGLAPVVAPVVAPIARAVGKGATALGMKAEKALEAPVTRTLEGGGRSAEMLRALGAQPSFAVPPSQPIFQHLPTSQAPFVGRLDDFVAAMPGPVQKDQFLGQLKGKFRDYDIKRAEETLADLPGNAKINPVDLLNRIKSKYDPSSFQTTVIPPKNAADFFQQMDNIFADRADDTVGRLGMIHLSHHVPPDKLLQINAAKDLESALSRASSMSDLTLVSGNLERMPIALANSVQKSDLPLSAPVKTALTDFLASNQSLFQQAGGLSQAYEMLRFPAISKKWAPLVNRHTDEIMQTTGQPWSLEISRQAQIRTIEDFFDDANQTLASYGFRPLDKPYFSSIKSPYSWYSESPMLATQLESSFKKATGLLSEGLREMSEKAKELKTLVQKDLKGVLPYRDQHASLRPSPDPIAFSRFSEHVTEIPGVGKANGIYVHELQSDRLDDIRKSGKRGGTPQADKQAVDEIDNKLAGSFVKRDQAQAQGDNEAVARLNDEIDGLSYRRARLFNRMRSGGYDVSESFANMENLPQVAQQLMAKNAVIGAIQMNKRFVAFPGEESAQSQLYEKLPRNLKDVVKDLGPGFEVRPIILQSSQGLESMHNAIVWSPEAAARLQKKGVPFKSGGMVERTYNDNRAYL